MRPFPASLPPDAAFPGYPVAGCGLSRRPYRWIRPHPTLLALSGFLEREVRGRRQQLPRHERPPLEMMGDCGGAVATGADEDAPEGALGGYFLGARGGEVRFLIYMFNNKSIKNSECPSELVPVDGRSKESVKRPASFQGWGRTHNTF